MKLATSQLTAPSASRQILKKALEVATYLYRWQRWGC